MQRWKWRCSTLPPDPPLDRPDLVIVGGGILGLATAKALLESLPHLKLRLLEKETQLAAHQSGHNSGVIHSGLYYPPGSQKARFCQAGRQMLLDFVQAQGLAHQVPGKLVLATREEEIPRLEALKARGEANGLTGLELLGPQGIKGVEPLAQGLLGLYVPQTGIVRYQEVAQAIASQIQEKGGVIRLGEKALDYDPKSSRLRTSLGEYSTPALVVCAGLGTNPWLGALSSQVRILPFRGDYRQLGPQATGKVRGLVYPVPNPELPFLGVHLTKDLEGGVHCGPNAIFSFAQEGYQPGAFDWQDSQRAFRFPGTWRLFARHWRLGLAELGRAASRRRFLADLQRLCPDIQAQDLLPCPSGVRAQAVGRNGSLVEDFWVEPGPRQLTLVNAPSPAATSALALGKHLAELAQAQLLGERTVQAV